MPSPRMASWIASIQMRSLQTGHLLIGSLRIAPQMLGMSTFRTWQVLVYTSTFPRWQVLDKSTVRILQVPTSLPSLLGRCSTSPPSVYCRSRQGYLPYLAGAGEVDVLQHPLA